MEEKVVIFIVPNDLAKQRNLKGFEMKELDKIIEKITMLRIKMKQKGQDELEQYAYEIDSDLCKLHDLLNNVGLANVVGRSEHYHCELYDFGRKDKPCDKQCDGCKAMNLD